MMNGNVSRIVDGSLTLTRIVYLCDLQHASGLQIPLGVMAEITLAHLRGLGLVARTELHDDEMASAGNLIRERLRAPFDFLRSEFDWAWSNTNAGTALQRLAGRNSESLFFSPPRSVMIRRAFKTESDVPGFAKKEMRDQRDAEFELMLAEIWGNSEPSTEDMARVAA
jgi:hypothetical protein